MTYRAWAGAKPTGYHFEKWGAPQTYMMLDIAAMQQHVRRRLHHQRRQHGL